MARRVDAVDRIAGAIGIAIEPAFAEGAEAVTAVEAHQCGVIDAVITQEIPAAVLFAQSAGVAQSAGAGLALAVGAVDRGVNPVIGLSGYRALGIGAQQNHFAPRRCKTAFSHRNVTGPHPAGLGVFTHLATELAAGVVTPARAISVLGLDDVARRAVVPAAFACRQGDANESAQGIVVQRIAPFILE